MKKDENLFAVPIRAIVEIAKEASCDDIVRTHYAKTDIHEPLKAIIRSRSYD